MKKNRITFFCLIVLVVASCQKEVDWGTGGGDAADKLLVKIISKTGPDSSITTYTYNAAKQITGENTTGVAGTAILDNELKIYRNNSGIIQKTVQVAAGFLANGIDSVVTRYNYNNTLLRYSSSVFSVTVSGTTVFDSILYVYDGSGKIVSDEHYVKASILPPVLNLKNQYTYSADGLNLTATQQLASTTLGGSLSQSTVQTFTFDTKKNPLIIKQEAIVLLRSGLFNAQNPLKMIVTNTSDPTNDYTMDYVYKFNTAEKPDSSYATRTPDATITASKYFYQ